MLLAENERLRDMVEWDIAVCVEVLEKAEPAGEGWFKVPPGTLTLLGELEEAARVALERKET